MNKRTILMGRLEHRGDPVQPMKDYLEELHKDLLDKVLATNDFALKQKHSGDLLRIIDLIEIFSKAG